MIQDFSIQIFIENKNKKFFQKFKIKQSTRSHNYGPLNFLHEKRQNISISLSILPVRVTLGPLQ